MLVHGEGVSRSSVPKWLLFHKFMCSVFPLPASYFPGQQPNSAVQIGSSAHILWVPLSCKLACTYSRSRYETSSQAVFEDQRGTDCMDDHANPWTITHAPLIELSYPPRAELLPLHCKDLWCKPRKLELFAPYFCMTNYVTTGWQK
jgi:hypothetical protein